MGVMGVLLEWSADATSLRRRGPLLRFRSLYGSLNGRAATPAGLDSAPLPGDKLYSEGGSNTGSQRVLGYVLKDGVSGPGETRIFARAEGVAPEAPVLMCDVRLRNDGSVEIHSPAADVVIEPSGSVSVTNNGGSIELTATGKLSADVTEFEVSDGVGTLSFVGGVLTVNGATITLTGDVVTASGVSLDSLTAHTHAAGTVPGTTGPWIP